MSIILVLVVLCSSLDFSLGMRYNQCTDQEGRVRSEGETWVVQGCRECVCMNGRVQCHNLAVECPPKPFPHCLEIPGPCCPQYDCTPQGPDCSAVSCPAPPQPHCQPIRSPGQCCAIGWDCSVCPDIPCQGPPRPDCTPFYPAQACCPQWDCNGPDCSTVFCPMPPQPSCRPLIRVGECCPYDYICGCTDNQGQPRGEGEVWQDPVTPCTVCSCHSAIRECFTGPQHCNVFGCVDAQGIPRNEGEQWQHHTNPCQFCTCDQGNAFCFIRDCPPPPNRPCTQPPVPGQCCRDCDPSLSYFN